MDNSNNNSNSDQQTVTTLQSSGLAYASRLIKDTISGAAAGAACVIAGQPLDTVKVKMQTFSHLYRGSLQCFMQTFRNEGLKGLYAGSSPAFLTNVAENSVLFLSYGRCLDATKFIFKKNSIDELQPIHRAIAGSMAAVVATLVICPTGLNHYIIGINRYCSLIVVIML